MPLTAPPPPPIFKYPAAYPAALLLKAVSYFLNTSVFRLVYYCLAASVDDSCLLGFFLVDFFGAAVFGRRAKGGFETEISFLVVVNDYKVLILGPVKLYRLCLRH